MAVTTHIRYFSRDAKFESEKPYTTTFPVDHIPGAEVTNHAWVSKRTLIQNLRVLAKPDLDTEGFTYLTMPTRLTYQDFMSASTVRTKYFEEIKDAVLRRFPRYNYIVLFDYEIRKRSPVYPDAVGTTVANAQPYERAHVDFTPYGAAIKIRGSLSDRPELANELLQKDYDVLNVWRLLRTTTPDWPLAFCDYQSINEQDPIKNDVVYTNGYGENCFLRHSLGHRWFYLQDQCMDEVWLWRNADANDSRPRAFHGSFRNPIADANSPLRESIEVRFAAFY